MNTDIIYACDQAQVNFEILHTYLFELQDIYQRICDSNNQIRVLDARIEAITVSLTQNVSSDEIMVRQQEALQHIFEEDIDSAREKSRIYGVAVRYDSGAFILPPGHPNGTDELIAACQRRHQEAMTQSQEIMFCPDSPDTFLDVLEKRKNFWDKNLQEELEHWEHKTVEYWNTRDRCRETQETVSVLLSDPQTFSRSSTNTDLFACMLGRKKGKNEMNETLQRHLLRVSCKCVYIHRWLLRRGMIGDANEWYHTVQKSWLNLIQFIIQTTPITNKTIQEEINICLFLMEGEEVSEHQLNVSIYEKNTCFLKSLDALLVHMDDS